MKQQPEFGRPEIVWRASGLGRPGLIAQFRLPKLNTRLALGLEVPLAHAVVDLLLGYDRPFGESRLQLTPVEWGVWTYVIVRSLEEFESSHSWQPRAGDDGWPGRPFESCARPGRSRSVQSGRLGRRGDTALISSRRLYHGHRGLWLPENALNFLLMPTFPANPVLPDLAASKTREIFLALARLAGQVAMPNGLKRLRVGGVLPLPDSRLTGTPQSPAGPITLVCGPTCQSDTFQFPAEPVEDASGRLVRITGSLIRQRQPRAPLALGINQIMSSTSASPANDAGGSPASPVATPLDVPVTLTVELGRVNLTVGRLADLRPGDLVELGRHSREPVELTSNGRLVARGELVLIDTELGVRVTHVFL